MLLYNNRLKGDNTEKKNKSYSKNVDKYQVVMANTMARHTINTPKETQTAALMYYAIAHIHNGSTDEEGDQEIKPICFDWREFAAMYTEPTTQLSCKRAVRKAAGVTVSFTDNATDREVTLPIFVQCTWKAGKVSLLVNQLLAPYLLNLSKQFATAPLATLMMLTGTHQRALFWFLTSQDNRIRRRVNIKISDMAEACNLPKSKASIYWVEQAIDDLNDGQTHFTNVVYDEHCETLRWGRKKRHVDEGEIKSTHTK